MNQLLVSPMNVSSTVHGQPHDDLYWYQMIPAVMGSFLGTVGAVMVLFTSLTSPVRAMSKRIIIMISLSDVLQALPTLLVASFDLEFHIRDKHEGSSYSQTHWWKKTTACKWQSFCITTGAMLTFLWTFGLSQHMFLLVRFGIKVAYKAYLSLYALSIVPFAVNIIAFYYDVLGRDTQIKTRNGTKVGNLSVWCWIKVTNETQNSTNFWRRPCPATFWDGKAFEIFCYIGVTVYCMLARYYLKQRSNYEQLHDSSGEEDMMSRNIDVNGRHTFAGSAGLQVDKILAIPLALILVRVWGTVARLSSYCADIPPPIFFIVLENFCDPLQGFVNCILYKLSLGESCTCRCPTMLGRKLNRRRGPRRGPSTSHGPVTVWVPQSTSSSSDY